MKYVLMTYHSPDHVDAWERSTAEEKRLEIARTVAWFRAQQCRRADRRWRGARLAPVTPTSSGAAA